MIDSRDVPFCDTCGYGSGGHDDWCESYQEMEWENKKLRAENERLRGELVRANQKFEVKDTQYRILEHAYFDRIVERKHLQEWSAAWKRSAKFWRAKRFTSSYWYTRYLDGDREWPKHSWWLEAEK